MKPTLRVVLPLSVALCPSVALADPMCRSPFVSVGCFLVTLLAAGVFSVPVAFLGALAVAILGRRAPGNQLALAVVGVFVVTLVTLFLEIAVAPAAHPGVTLGVCALVTGGYSALMVRRLSRLSPRPGV